RDRGSNLVHLGQTGCPPLLNIERLDQAGDNNCVRVNAAVLDAGASDAAITDVWLSFRGAMAVTASGFGDGAERQTEMFRSTDRATVNAGAVEAGLRATIGYLKAR